MRRKDREMGKDFAIEIIDKSDYGILSMVGEDGRPYGLPLSLVREGENLYFHSAIDGKKVRALAKNPRVSIAFVGRVNVPDLYTREELDGLAEDRSKFFSLISKVFTTEFESALVEGRADLVEGEEERVRAMRLICEKYTPSKMDYFDLAIESGLSRVNIYRVKIEEIRAKRKKFDEKGEEMKYGRME